MAVAKGCHSADILIDSQCHTIDRFVIVATNQQVKQTISTCAQSNTAAIRKSKEGEFSVVTDTSDFAIIKQ
jgi:hypothetical protein